MGTGNRYPLDAFERALRADPDVVGVALSGSVGQGAGDAWSDLDFELVLSPRVADPRRRAEELCQALGPLRFAYWRDDLLTAFVGPTWQRIDLRVVARDQLAPSPALAGARVLADRDGGLADVVRRSGRPDVSIDAVEARRELAAAIDTQIYVALHNARGAVWSATGELVFRQGRMYALLARLRGVEVFGLREVESLLAPEERAEFERAWPSTATHDEVRRAARALWTFTRRVGADVAANLGAQAVPEVDETALLAGVDAVYARR